MKWEEGGLEGLIRGVDGGDPTPYTPIKSLILCVPGICVKKQRIVCHLHCVNAICVFNLFLLIMEFTEVR